MAAGGSCRSGQRREAGKGGAGVREAAEGTAREAAEGLLDVAKGAPRSPGRVNAPQRGRIAAGLRSATLQVFSQALRVLPRLFCGGFQVSRAVPWRGLGQSDFGRGQGREPGVWKIEGRKAGSECGSAGKGGKQEVGAVLRGRAESRKWV